MKTAATTVVRKDTVHEIAGIRRRRAMEIWRPQEAEMEAKKITAAKDRGMLKQPSPSRLHK